MEVDKFQPVGLKLVFNSLDGTTQGGTARVEYGPGVSVFYRGLPRKRVDQISDRASHSVVSE